MIKNKTSVMSILTLVILSSSLFSHPGAKDSNGGHKDENNLSGLGKYHFHHGCAPHLHPEGKCPFLQNIYIPVESLDILSDNIFVAVNDTVRVNLKLIPENSTSKSIFWNSSNIEIVTVDQNGVITGISTGKTLVTARSGNWKSDAAVVIVY